MEGKLRKRMNRIIDAFDNACAKLAGKSSRLPAEWYDIEETHRAARQDLIAFIEEMDSRLPTAFREGGTEG